MPVDEVFQYGHFMKSRFLCIALYALLIGGLISCSSGDSNAVSGSDSDGSGGGSSELDGLEDRLSVGRALQEAFVYPELIFEFIAFIVNELETGTEALPLFACDIGSYTEVSSNDPLAIGQINNPIDNKVYNVNFVECYVERFIVAGAIDFTFQTGTDASISNYVGEITFNNFRFLEDGGITVNGTINYNINFNADELNWLIIDGGNLQVDFDTLSPFEQTQSTYTFTTNSINYTTPVDINNGNAPQNSLELGFTIDSGALGTIINVDTGEDILADDGSFSKEGQIELTTATGSEVSITAEPTGSKTFDLTAVDSNGGAVAVDASTWCELMANPTTDFLIPNGNTCL